MLERGRGRKNVREQKENEGEIKKQAPMLLYTYIHNCTTSITHTYFQYMGIQKIWTVISIYKKKKVRP